MEPTMKLEEAEVHAERWIRAWNTHDLEAVLATYDDEIVLRSSRASTWDPTNKDGAIRGKAALRAYFATALERFPELEMSILGIYVGQGERMVLEYLNRPVPGTEIYVLERTRFANRLAVEVDAAYGTERSRA